MLKSLLSWEAWNSVILEVEHGLGGKISQEGENKLTLEKVGDLPEMFCQNHVRLEEPNIGINQV